MAMMPLVPFAVFRHLIRIYFCWWQAEGGMMVVLEANGKATPPQKIIKGRYQLGQRIDIAAEKVKLKVTSLMQPVPRWQQRLNLNQGQPIRRLPQIRWLLCRKVMRCGGFIRPMARYPLCGYLP